MIILTAEVNWINATFKLMLAFLQLSLSPFNSPFYSILPTLPTIVKSILEHIQSYVTILHEMTHNYVCFLQLFTNLIKTEFFLLSLQADSKVSPRI